MTIRFGNKIIAGYPDKFVFSLVPVPASATVTITGGTQVKNAVIAKAGTSVHWKVEAAGYEPMEGDKVIGNSDESLMVELVELPKEIFKFTINSGSDSKFILPLSSDYAISNRLTSYDMNVDWGDGQTETITGNASDGHGVTHTYASPNQDYEITLTPAGDEDGWGCMFGFGSGYPKIGCNVTENRKKVLSLNAPYTKSMVIRGDNRENVLTYAWQDCESLTRLSQDFNLPQDISGGVSSNFCSYMFTGCTRLTSVPEGFSLPAGLTNVGDWFCSGMFSGCSKLATAPKSLKLPAQIQSVGTGFCSNVFNSCRALLGIPEEFLVLDGLTTVGNEFFSGAFMACTSLQAIPATFRIPQGIKTVGTRFCFYLFSGCSSLKTGVIDFFGNISLPSSELNKSGVFEESFYECGSLEEEISPATIPQLAVSPSSSNKCFKRANSTAIANCPANWK